MPRYRTRALALAALAAVAALSACGGGQEPQEPPTSGTPSASPTAVRTASPTTVPTAEPTQIPSVAEGRTLRQLGFKNGPAKFSVPSDAVISTSVDQPNVVTIVLSRPSPDTVEEYLRATLPSQGFTISARGTAGNGAMTFEGNGWIGGFTATAATSAIVLRPA